MNSMYVWEVREVSPYDGVLYQTLIKDNSEALSRIKEIVLVLSEYEWNRPLIDNMDISGGYFEVENKSTDIEVKKIEVL